MDRAYIRHHVTGPIVSIGTPFTRDGAIDFDGLRRFVDYAIDAGARTVLLTPGDSLYPVLTDKEVADVTRVVAGRIGGRAMFIAAADCWWTGKAIEYARHAREVGATAMIVFPPIRGTTEDELVAYYAAISAELPVFVLSGSLRSLGIDGAVRAVRRLCDEVEGIAGLKEDFSPQFARRACLETHEKWAIFAGGQKQTHMDMHPYGCDGYMSIFMTFRPDVAHAYWKAIEAGDIANAVRIIRDFDMPVFRFLYSEFPAGGDAGLHVLTEIAGICGRWRRSPLPDFSDEEVERVRSFVDSLPPL